MIGLGRSFWEEVGLGERERHSSVRNTAQVIFNNNIHCNQKPMKIVLTTKESPNHKLYMRYKGSPMNGLVCSRWKVPKRRKC